MSDLIPRSPLTVAFVGGGDVPERVVGKLLADFIGQNEVFAIIPAEKKSSRSQPGLNRVWDWLTNEDIQFDEEPMADIVAKLQQYQGEGDDCYLIACYDPNDPEAIISVIVAAADAGIPVLDLGKQLDNIEIAAEEPPDEPQRPARGRRRGAPRVDDPPAAEAVSEPSEDADEAQATDTVNLAIQGAGTWAEGASPDRTADELWAAVMLALKALIKIEVQHEMMRAPGVHAQDEQAAEERRIAAIMGEDGGYRLPGRGRRRKGDEDVTLSESEARAVLSEADQEKAGLK